MLSNIITRLLGLGDNEGLVVFVKGPEGSGKTTLAYAVAEAHAGTGVIPFSKVLSSFLTLKERDPDYANKVKIAREKMSKRKKDINHGLLCGALRHAISLVPAGKRDMVVIEGFLRKKEQCKDALQIIAEFFPRHLLVCVEAVCSRSVAHARATGRGQDNDRAEFIRICHDEYWNQLEVIRESCSWGYHLEVSTEDEPDQTLRNLALAFNNLAEQLASPEFKLKQVKTPEIILGLMAAAA